MADLAIRFYYKNNTILLVIEQHEITKDLAEVGLGGVQDFGRDGKWWEVTDVIEPGD